MVFRKGILFVAFITSLILSNRVAEAKLPIVTGPSADTLAFVNNYNFKQDPFLMDWSFGINKSVEKVERVAPVVPLTFEEKTLERWKEKQAHLWTNLPKAPFVINASAYTAAADECGKSDGITASGLKVAKKRTLACPPAFPFGTKIRIDGMGEFRCEDRGGAIKGNKMDIYMETKKEAFAFGRRTLTAQVISE